jgi:ankyrin repeat protein
LFAASLQGHDQIVSILIAAGANVDIANNDGVTPLYVAALNGDEKISSLLIAAKADANISRKDGTSPLFKAAVNGKLPIVMDLVSAGALVDSANTDGATPIFMAALYGYSSIVSYLLSNGADASIEGKAPDYPYKVTPLEIAHAKDHDRIYAILSKHGHEIAKDGVYALKWAAIRGNQAELSRLLALDHINKEKDTLDPKEFGGRNSLMLACYFGRTQCVSALLAAGCDMTLKASSASDKIGSDAASPIVFAALGGNLECLKLLLDKGVALEKAGKGRKGKK